MKFIFQQPKLIFNKSPVAALGMCYYLNQQSDRRLEEDRKRQMEDRKRQMEASKKQLEVTKLQNELLTELVLQKRDGCG